MSEALYHVEYGASADKDAPVLVLLHGFGGDHHSFHAQYRPLSRQFRVIGFDLPGHGRSLHVSQGEKTGLSAERLWAALDEKGIERINLCGHSMGGAVAALMALKQPQRVETLTLVAPGGFGPEINARLLFRFAAAHERPMLDMVMEQFYGFRHPLPDKVVAAIEKARRDKALRNSIMGIAQALFGNGVQGVLPRDELFALDVSIKVLWGTQDNVLPTRQAHKLPGHVAAHVFDGAGHMVHEERPDEVTRLLIAHRR